MLGVRRFCLLGVALAAAPGLWVQGLWAQADQPVASLRANSNLVIVDVTVTDEHHQPVHGLKAEEFSVLENGHAQQVKTFEEHAMSATAPAPVPLPAEPPGVFSNRTAVPEDGVLNILLLDKLNTPLKDQSFMIAQLRDYLKTMRPGTRIAIFGLTTRLRMLQGFTSDPALLRAIVEGKKGLPGASAMLNDSMNGDTGASNTPFADQIQTMLGDSPDAATTVANLAQFEAEQDSFMQMMRVRYTLDGFNVLARYLENLPGRKNLLWFSASFPISILPDGDLQNPFAVVADAEDEFRQTTDMLARSRVAVYPVDARGLMVSPMYDVSKSGPTTGRAAMKAQASFFNQTSSEHGTMMELAEATGGRAFVNTNGLKEAAEAAINEGSSYYTLTYAPNSAKWQGEYRKIQVKLARQGLTLNFRRGYYADDPNDMKAIMPQAQIVDGKPVPGLVPSYDALHAAMLHGGPGASQIHFEAAVRPNDAGTQPGAVQSNSINPKSKGPFRVYTVHFMVTPRDVNCDLAGDHQHHCRIQFISQVFDPDGVPQAIQANDLEAVLNDAKYNVLQNGRLAYNQQISVPAKGDFYLRVGVGDMATGKVGTLEVPVLAVAKLPPLNSMEKATVSH
ncbi:VWA domain-containing protein [Telmatobacter bradus]|uniref:VWA domain-containing protein n=1 Tax=Telmatobacter bradus TaxID=474953 RepID=UPI003B43ACC3